jgi:type II secretory pathway component PulJ|tara:strand:+ start:8040 stop:8909 length:870 start_codon:yes stop_codon:yes gene_type:complete
MKKKFINILGFTLVEILIAIVITSLMMAAMFTSYSIVNSTYRQVTDRAKISQAGRDTVGVILREIRMAGFKYLNDNIAASDQHSPIQIYKGSGLAGTCDTIQIVYGGIKGPPDNSGIYEYERYRITYQCIASTKIEDSKGTGDKVKGFIITKCLEKWDSAKKEFTHNFSPVDDSLYCNEQVLDYVQDLVFIPYDEKGKPLTSTSSDSDYTGTYIPSNDDVNDIRTIDIALVVRSSRQFYRKDKLGNAVRKIMSIASTKNSNTRNISETDKFFRDTITVTANARNIGLDQ